MKEKSRGKIIFSMALFILVVIILIGIYLLSISRIHEISGDQITVEVIDGDTFRFMGKEKSIRLLCIDAPESGEPGFEESRDYLESLLYGEIRLEFSDFGREDRYGRTLAFVYVSDLDEEVFVNKKLLEEGYASILEINEGECDILR